MLGNNKEPEKKGQEPPKKVGPPSFGSKPSIGPSKPLQPTSKPLDGKPKMDSFQRTNKADRGTGPLNAGSHMNLTQQKENRDFTEKALDDGTVIIKYNEPQKIDNLIKDAKSRVGGQTSKFFSKGWVIGKEVAKISPDGLSITYYPREVSDLVHELIGYSDDEK